MSLRPEDSDRIINAILLQNLVGTLTTYESSGKIVPNLAQKWDVDSSGRVWTFELRPDLKCEDGSVIDAQSFVSNLKRQFKAYSKMSPSGSLSSFDQVIGMKDFLDEKTDDLKGVSVKGKNSIVFSLHKRPDSFIEDLVGVYYGYWCPGNFADGKFRSDGHFISSGTYSLAGFNPEQANLKLRKNWFRVVDHVPEEVEIRALKSKDHIGSKVRTIVQAGIEYPKFDDLGDYNVVPGSPAMLTALKVSPYAASGFFKSVGQRRLFRKKIIDSNLLARLPKDGVHASHLFFGNATSKTMPVEIPKEFVSSKQPIKVCLTHAYSSLVMDTIKSTISEILPETTTPVEFVYTDRSKPNWYKELHEGTAHDIQITSVVVGGYFLNSQTQFMFCTRLGVSFWDTSGRICKLADAYSDSRPIDQKYVDRFNQVLEEDATVIPLFHSGMFYIYSHDIDPQSITTESANYPPFDTLRIL